MVSVILKCVECKTNERWSRGLCSSCYSTAHRGGFLSEYPTKAFLDDPESAIRWAFGFYPELVEEVAVEFGKRVTVTDYEGGLRG